MFILKPALASNRLEYEHEKIKAELILVFYLKYSSLL